MNEWTYPDRSGAEHRQLLAADEGAGEPFRLRVSELRQFWFCARLLYYFYCLPDVRPTTYKLEEGLEQHREEVLRERRRGLSFYGLEGVEERARKRFDVVVESERLALRGRLDAVIEVEEDGCVRAYPVEYKATRREPGAQYRLQLAAYALLLEEQEGCQATEGFFVLLPLRKVLRVRLDRAAMARAEKAVLEMHRIIRGESLPPPPKSAARCSTCEFRRFCNDVW